MFSPVQDLAEADAGVQAVLGIPPRFYSFGEAPSPVTKPYATWQTVNGSPENLLSGRPTDDDYTNQVDVYGDTPKQAKAAAKALVRAFELSGYITSWNLDGRDVPTKLWRISFNVEFITPR